MIDHLQHSVIGRLCYVWCRMLWQSDMPLLQLDWAAFMEAFVVAQVPLHLLSH